ncbi:YkgJ family cysteine cluster protein [Sediminibacterium goheungense]|uniref:YkgJ family cysteine cluster protein n=1 Tax=Sediminibacterium goheungense TaxID=1086393 RepID=UPI00105DDA0E|nr:YkgJ family cysteine cluster protein [Sediminibacterium goheungense]
MDREAENDLFAHNVKEMDPLVIDQMVHKLNQDISPRIDCTVCGNCCKTLLINVEEGEANRLTNHLALSRTDFDHQYLEKGSNGMMIMNAIPCSFLTEKKCSVYEFRFDGCREFPAMHLPGFSKRLFTTLMHYGRCPIIFNIVEAMKEQMSDV